METKKFLTTEEVAAEFGLDADSLKNLVDSGEVHALADRGTWKYRRDELQALSDAGKLSSLSDGPIHIHTPDDVSYIELDEEALDEQATMIKKSGDASPLIETDSDSDVKIAPEYHAKAEDSGIVLDFDVESGATVSSSGSSLRLPQSVPGAVEGAASGPASDLGAWDEVAVPEDSGIHLSGDSAIGGIAASDLKLPTGKSSVIGIGKSGDSDLVMDDDSGLAMAGDSGFPIGDDSGLAVEAEDVSGISIEGIKPDSGITLGGVDSGIALGGDSGIAISGADSGLSVDPNARTVPDTDFGMKLAGNKDADRTQTIDLNAINDDSSFDINLDDSTSTREIQLEDDDADETSATVVRKGRPPKGALSAAFELDEPAEVEDLEISEELDADVDEELEELGEIEEEEEVFDASEEAFGAEEAEAVEDEEDYLEAAEKTKKKPTGPREPAWGMDMTIGLVGCTLFLVANSLILWGGVSTMWSGADIEGPAGSLVSTFADLIPK